MYFQHTHFWDLLCYIKKKWSVKYCPAVPSSVNRIGCCLTKENNKPQEFYIYLFLLMTFDPLPLLVLFRRSERANVARSPCSWNDELEMEYFSLELLSDFICFTCSQPAISLHHAQLNISKHISTVWFSIAKYTLNWNRSAMSCDCLHTVDCTCVLQTVCLQF